MKSCEVLNLMNISRQTLSKYVKTGKLKVRTLPNGDYDYDMESACEILNGGRRRTVVVYMGECGSDALRKEREAAVECFMKDNLGENVTVVSDDDEYDMADILMDVQRFAVKSLVIMDDDYETIGRVECLGPMFAAARCEVKLLQAVKRD